MKLRLTLTTLLAIFTVASAFAESPAPSELHFGATMPLSGDYATYGQLIQDGIELARDDLKEKGINVRFSYEDVPTPGPSSLTAIRKLIEQEKIAALAANFWNPAIPVMAPVISKYQLPSFHTAAADDLILESGDYIFSTNSRVRDEAYLMAEYAFEKLGVRRASIAYISTTFGEQYAEHIRDRFTELGGAILSFDMTMIDATDNRAVLSRIKSYNPDILFAAHFGSNLGRLLKQARELGLNQKILTVYEAEDPSVLEAAKGNVESVLFFVSEPVGNSKEIEHFVERFEARFGYYPGILGRNAYDATQLLATAFTSCASHSGDVIKFKERSACVKDRMYHTKNYPGMSGTLTIEADGASSKQFVLKNLRDYSLKASVH